MDANGVLQPVKTADVLNVVQGTGPYVYSDLFPLVIADLTQEGRFAIVVPRTGTCNTDMIILEVYVTEDGCRSSRRRARMKNMDEAARSILMDMIGGEICLPRRGLSSMRRAICFIKMSIIS